MRTKAISPVELTRACLQRIERLNPTLNAFITVTAEQAIAQARDAEAEVRHGRWRGPLHGIPVGIKDNIDTAGVRTTLASAVFKDRVPSADAEVVRRLTASGAVLLGKQNRHEVAFGTTAAISYFGPVHNPWQLDRIAGGSSGGSAAAVAAGLCFGAVGTDAGGSMSVPSGYCGIVGLKPTYGLVGMRGGGEAGWWSMNHLGPDVSQRGGRRDHALRDSGLRPARQHQRRGADSGLHRGAADQCLGATTGYTPLRLL